MDSVANCGRVSATKTCSANSCDVLRVRGDEHVRDDPNRRRASIRRHSNDSLLGRTGCHKPPCSFGRTTCTRNTTHSQRFGAHGYTDQPLGTSLSKVGFPTREPESHFGCRRERISSDSRISGGGGGESFGQSKPAGEGRETPIGRFWDAECWWRQTRLARDFNVLVGPGAGKHPRPRGSVPSVATADSRTLSPATAVRAATMA